MPTLTAQELEYLRDDHPHKTLLYMSVLQPATVYVGQVTGSPERGARQITVSDVSGSIGSIVAGMTALIGTSNGTDDVSRRRVRSVAGQVITFDENSTVWANGQYVAVITFWELWPVFPFITDTPPYTFYKDYDIAYTDQNADPSPVAIAGAHQAGFLSSGSAVFPLVASASYAIAPGASISSYSWACDDGTIANASAASTTITFTDPHPDGIWVTLTVTDSNGKTQTTRRVIFVHEREGANAPHRDFVISSPITGSWQNSGYMCSVDVYDNALITDIPDRTLIVLWQEPYYAGTLRDIAGQGNVVFTGYIKNESIQRNLAAGKVSFDMATVHDKLHNKNSFSVSLVDDLAPDTWWKYANLTLTRAIHHLWKWHSTLLDVADVFIVDSSLRLPACDDFSEGDLLKIVDDFASQHGIHAHPCCNKRGQMYVEVDIQMLNDAGRNAIDTVMPITSTDRREEDDFSIRRTKEGGVALVMLSGVAYDGTTVTPLISKAPGEVPEADGVVKVSVERQILADQTDANERSGRYLALANNILTDGQVKFAGNYSFVDLVPQEWYTISIQFSETKRGIVLTDMRFVPRTVIMPYDFQSGTLLPDVVLDAEAIGEDGIPGRYPTEIEPAAGPQPPPDDDVGMLLTFDETNGCHLYTSWHERNGALSGVNIQDHHGGVDPWWFINQDSIDPNDAILWKCDTGKIYRSTDQGQSWVDMTPGTSPPNDANDDPAPGADDLTYFWYEGNVVVNHQHVFLAKWQNASNEWRSWILLTENDGTSWTWKYVGSSGGGCGGGDFVLTDTTAGQNLSGQELMKFTDAFALQVNYISGGDSIYDLRFYDYDGNFLWSHELSTHTDGGAISSHTYRLVELSDTLFASVLLVVLDGVVGRLATVQIYSIDWGGETVTLEDSLLFHGVGDTTLRVMSTNRLANVPVLGADYYVMFVTHYQQLTIGGGDQLRVYTFHYDGSISSVDSGIVFSDDTYGIRADFMSLYLVNESALRIFHCYFARNVPNIRGVEIQIDDSGLIDQTVYHDVVTDGNPINVVAAHIGDTLSMLAWLDQDDGNNIYGTYIGMSSSGYSSGIIELIEAYPGNVGIAMTPVGTDRAMLSYYRDDVPTSIVTRCVSRDGSGIAAGDEQIIDTVVAVSQSIVAREHMVIAYSKTSAVLRIGIGAFAGPVRLLGMSIAKGVGEKLYVTGHNGSDLICGVYELPSLDLVLEFAFGSASDSDVDNFVKIIYPYAIYGSDDACMFYGRIGSTPVHLISTEDGGVNVTVVEDDFGDDYIGAFAIDTAGRMFGVVNNGSTGRLCSGYISLPEKMTLPFEVGVNAILPYAERFVLVGAKTVAGGQMILKIRRPYTTIDTDVTENHPTDGSITAIVVT